MVKYALILIISILGCSPIKSKLLKDHITEVPSDPEFFTKKYRNKYTVSLAQGIDTDAVYIEQYYVDLEGKLFKTGIEKKDELVSVFKFYNNSCVNEFIIKNSEIKNLPELDPEIIGHRGISYNKKNSIHLDVIAPIDEFQNLGKTTYKLKVSGDTLFLNDYNNRGGYIYLKQKISSAQIKYTADW